MQCHHQHPSSTIHRPIRAGFRLAFLFVLALILPLGPTHADDLTLAQWLDLGWDYYNAGDVEEAFNTFLQAVDLFPDSAEAHLALGEMYLELGVTDRGRAHILRSLQLDDYSPLASRAHYNYALSIREEDPGLALTHLDRAHHLGGSIGLQFEIAHQVRFCRLLARMSERSESGLIVLHYPPYLLTREDGDASARAAESSSYLVESFCSFDIRDPVHFFLYPSERALRGDVGFESDERDPTHREFHLVYTPELDTLPFLCIQVVSDMQNALNRHAGAGWVLEALPVAVTGRVPWPYTGAPPGEDARSSVDCDDAVRALVDAGAVVDLRYFRSEEYAPYVDPALARAELGSFLRWVRRTYETRKLQELLTQPNIELILDGEMDELQDAWLQEIAGRSSLISDPEHAERWGAELPISPFAGDPDLPLTVLREGIRLYLDGAVASGKRKIHRALDLDPGFGLGYYTLGWIACREGRWEEAEEQLGMAVILLEEPAEIAWCHTSLAPIYLHDTRWELAQASLRYVLTTIESPAVRTWAEDLLARVAHILALRPIPLERDSAEFDEMRDFLAIWNQAANSDSGPRALIGELMENVRASSLNQFYLAIRREYPSVVFNHALQAVGRPGPSPAEGPWPTRGSALHLEVRIRAAFPGLTPRLSPTLESLTEDGYLRYLKVMPSDDGWRVLDWEDGWFPLGTLRHIAFPDPENEELTALPLQG